MLTCYNEGMKNDDNEKYFTAIKEDIDRLRKEMLERFDKQDQILELLLDMQRSYDEERRELKASLWELDRRVSKIEKSLA